MGVEDFFKENAVMDFPKGGSGELMAALARGVTKRDGCSVDVSTGVEEVIVEGGRAVGVKLAKSGRIIRAKEAVISNADLTNAYNFVAPGQHRGIDTVGNVVVVSVGSKLDPSLAPPGYHVIHAYTAGNEPYADWEQFEHLMDDPAARRKDEAYQKFKDERAPGRQGCLSSRKGGDSFDALALSVSAS